MFWKTVQELPVKRNVHSIGLLSGWYFIRNYHCTKCSDIMYFCMHLWKEPTQWNDKNILDIRVISTKLLTRGEHVWPMQLVSNITGKEIFYIILQEISTYFPGSNAHIAEHVSWKNHYSHSATLSANKWWKYIRESSLTSKKYFNPNLW